MPLAPLEVDFRVLGPLEVWVRRAPVAVRGHKQRTVLAVLILHVNEVVSSDQLIDVLWGEHPPASAEGTLRAYLSRMRASLQRALGDGADPLIVGRPPGYVLSLPTDGTDAARFETLVAAGAAAAHDRPVDASATLHAALRLWRGPAFAEFVYDDFADQEIARLDELRLMALGCRIEADLVLGQTAGLAAELHSLTRQHPVREAFHAQLIRVMMAQGRRAEALVAYGHAVDTLRDELGVKPGPELRGLEASLLDDHADTVDSPRLVPMSLPASLEGRPPPEMTSPAAQLPSVLTRFVGRQREVSEVIALTARHRLVTVTGTGGSGKTRLAIEVAADTAVLPGRRVLFVDLSDAEPASLKSTVAFALGVRPEGVDTLGDVLANALDGPPTLLVLDNCEQVIAEAADLVASALLRCPGLVVLATSRQPLMVRGERVWRMPSLSMPDPDSRSLAAALQSDAVRLFIDRALAARSDVALGDDDAAAIVLICRRLDGLPLAIELAAARLTVLTPGEIAARLDDSLRVLSGGPRDGPDRHRALEATLDWSYHLLAPAERQLLARLSVFRGTFTHDAVTAVCGWGDLLSENMLDRLAGLVDKSLVVAAVLGSSSYFRLLETVRQYGAERAEVSGEGLQLRARHAAFYTDQVRVTTPLLRGPEAPAALGWLDRYSDDIHAALSWLEGQPERGGLLELAAVVWPYWDYRYLVTEGREWLARALRAPARPITPSRAMALSGAAKLAWMDDDPGEANRACREGLGVAHELGQPASRAPFLVILAELARDRGDDQASIDTLCQEAADLFTATGDLSGAADAMRVMALLALDHGDLASAERRAGQCLDLWDNCGDVERSAGIRLLLAGLSVERGQFVEAECLYQEGLGLFHRAKEPWGTAQAICSLAALANLQRQPLRAVSLAEDSLERHRRLGEHRGVAISLKAIADASLQLGWLDQADRFAGEALAGFRRRGLARDIEGALLSVAAVALRRGQLDRASQACEEAVIPYRLKGQRGMAAVGVTLLGIVAVRRQDLSGAAVLLEEGRRLAELDPDRGVIGATLAVLLERSDTELDLRSPVLGVRTD